MRARTANLAALLKPREQRRLLALDGGGIRGAIAIEILAAIEAAIRDRHGDPKLVLADWFDYVAGTSTGAIIATLISLGLSVDEIRAFYHERGALMFDRAMLLQRLWYTYRSDELRSMLKSIFGERETLGSEKLRTLLLLVMRNATTDSHWPLSNNPDARYNDRTPSNLDLPLWQLVRASTAAPTFFPPEEVEVMPGKPPFLFVDGGVTTYNNPAFILFLMATAAAYKLEWPAGEDRMLLVSVGTGSSAAANAGLLPSDMNLLYNVQKIPAALMYASLVQQDTLCRVLGRCVYGAPLDREIGALDVAAGAPPQGKLFRYVRYDPELSSDGLVALGLSAIPIANVQRMDSAEHINDLATLGRTYAEQHFKADHLEPFYERAREA